MKKLSALAMAMAFASIGNEALGNDFTPPRTSRIKGSSSRLTQLTPKQKRRRKLNKIGRKTRKLNFKH